MDNRKWTSVTYNDHCRWIDSVVHQMEKPPDHTCNQTTPVFYHRMREEKLDSTGNTTPVRVDRTGSLSQPSDCFLPIDLDYRRWFLDFSRFFTSSFMIHFFPHKSPCNKFLIYEFVRFDNPLEKGWSIEMDRKVLSHFTRDRNGGKIKESGMVAVVNPICLVSLSAGMGREEDAHFSQ